MSSRPVSVLLVADDGTLLSQLARLLNLLHYHVEQVQPDYALTALDAAPSDVLLVDWYDPAERVWELCRAAQQVSQPDPLLTLLVAERLEPSQISEAIEAGVDDFLSRPIIVGELLVRLRAAARGGEFERRLRARSRRDAVTGFRTRSGLRADLGRTTAPSAAAIALAIDFPDAVAHQWGKPVAHAAVHGVAAALRAACDPSAMLAHLGGGRFAVVQPGRTLTEAMVWTEELRRLLASQALPGDQAPLTLTLSAGIAVAPHDAPPGEPLLARAEEALDLACRTGRNRVVAAADLQREADAWAEWARPGSLLDRTCARDVMIACPLVLTPDEPLTRVARLGAMASDCPLPVAGADGRFVGVLLPEDAAAPERTSGGAEVRVADRMIGNVRTFDGAATLAELMAFFREDDRPLAVVTSQGRAVGWVTPSLLAGLNAPLTTSTFAPEDLASAGLAVPEPALFVG